MPSSNIGVAGQGAGETPRPKIVAVSTSATEALEEVDRELTQPDFLGDIDTVGTSHHWEGAGVAMMNTEQRKKESTGAVRKMTMGASR